MKKKILSLFNGLVIPVVGSQLKGLRLRFSSLLTASLFWRNTEPEKHLLYKLLIKENDVILDVGANIGLHSYFFSKWFKGVKIYSFEPLPENASYINDIVRLNRLSNIEVINCAIGSSTGHIYFNVSTSNYTGFISKQKTELEVELESLDHFIASRKICPNFIKIDVEGAEADVLDGFRGQIETVLPVLIIESHSPANDKAISEFFKRYNYAIYRLAGLNECKKGKLLVTIKNLESTWPDPEGVFGNIVAIPMNRKYEIKQFVVD